MDRLTEITVVDKEPHKLLSGEMARFAKNQYWYIGCPNPECSKDPVLHGVSNIGGHTVTKSNGVITVWPSILCGCGAHYFIEHNQIRWC